MSEESQLQEFILKVRELETKILELQTEIKALKEVDGE